jgi:hypothetical protein
MLGLYFQLHVGFYGDDQGYHVGSQAHRNIKASRLACTRISQIRSILEFLQEF